MAKQTNIYKIPVLRNRDFPDLKNHLYVRMQASNQNVQGTRSNVRELELKQRMCLERQQIFTDRFGCQGTL